MEPMDAPISDTRNMEMGKNHCNISQVESFKSCIDDIFTKVDKVNIFGQMQTMLNCWFYNYDLNISLCWFYVFHALLINFELVSEQLW